MVALSGAEVLTVAIEPRVGLWTNSALLIALIVQTALGWRRPFYRLYLSLVMVPTIRLVSLTMPLAGFPQIYWYLATSVPLIASAWLIARVVGLTPARIGLASRPMLTAKGIGVQVLVGCSGLAFGVVEYWLLRPPLLAASPAWQDLALPALILLVCTGFAEELMFRGVMQRAAVESLGRWGLPYVSLIFAVLHIGHQSWPDIPFVFVVAMFFAWVVSRTRSIWGVTVAHGVTNILLFLVMPALAQVG